MGLSWYAVAWCAAAWRRFLNWGAVYFEAVESLATGRGSRSGYGGLEEFREALLGLQRVGRFEGQ